jgi:hypothetical protein
MPVYQMAGLPEKESGRRGAMWLGVARGGQERGVRLLVYKHGLAEQLVHLL